MCCLSADVQTVSKKTATVRLHFYFYDPQYMILKKKKKGSLFWFCCQFRKEKKKKAETRCTDIGSTHKTKGATSYSEVGVSDRLTTFQSLYSFFSFNGGKGEGHQ